MIPPQGRPDSPDSGTEAGPSGTVPEPPRPGTTAGGVLHLTSMWSYKYGAMERYLIALADRCARAGRRTILQYEARPDSAAYLKDLERAGVVVAVARTHRAGLAGVWNLFRLVQSVRPEILHVHFTGGMSLVAVPFLAAAYRPRKLLATVHSMPISGRFSPRPMIYDRCDAVIGVSRAVTEDLRRAGVSEAVLSTLYLGLFDRQVRPESRERARRELGIPPSAVVTGCIGFDHPIKGIDILLQAFARLSGRAAGSRLLIIGVDSTRSALPGLAQRLGIGDRVNWAGIRDDARELLAAVDLYVQPSRSEGLGLGAVEAMSMHLAVVATAVGGLPEAVVDGTTGLLVEAGEPAVLAAALSSLLEQPERRKAMGEAGWERYLRFFRGEDSVRSLVSRYYGLTLAG